MVVKSCGWVRLFGSNRGCGLDTGGIWFVGGNRVCEGEKRDRLDRRCGLDRV